MSLAPLLDVCKRKNHNYLRFDDATGEKLIDPMVHCVESSFLSDRRVPLQDGEEWDSAAKGARCMAHHQW